LNYRCAAMGREAKRRKLAIAGKQAGAIVWTPSGSQLS
jgi:hypothetical protein